MRDRAGPPADPQDGVADGHGGQPGRAHRDPGDQGGRARAVEWILDKAIQAHGAAGVSQDFPLARWYASTRTLRLADGPDEVHKNSLARRELAKYRGTMRPTGRPMSGDSVASDETARERLRQRGHQRVRCQGLSRHQHRDIANAAGPESGRGVRPLPVQGRAALQHHRGGAPRRARGDARRRRRGRTSRPASSSRSCGRSRCGTPSGTLARASPTTNSRR